MQAYFSDISYIIMQVRDIRRFIGIMQLEFSFASKFSRALMYG